MDEFNKKLQEKLRQVDGTISMYDIAKEFGIHVDELLKKIIPIKDEFMNEYKNNFKNMLKPDNKDFMKEFLKKDIIDLGFLVQHKIKEIADSLQKKHNTMGHQMFYDSWILYRGY